ncbi:hypothetical protein SBADM41S_12146 [Streptomyces badius]
MGTTFSSNRPGSSMRIRPICMPPTVSIAAPRIEMSMLYVRESWEMTGWEADSPWKVTSTTVRSGPEAVPPTGNSSSASSEPGVARSSPTVPDSTIRPRRMSAAESQMVLTTSISWVMSRTVRPSCWLRSRSSWRMERVVSGSSAEVASSESSTWGSPARARAMPTRCFWPPESCPG